MTNEKKIEWALRIGVAGEFLGHGMLAVGGKAQWVRWMGEMIGTSPDVSLRLIQVIGVSDILIALLVLVYPFRLALLWAALWGFWTALLRPLVGESFWDFIERFANWGAPLALLFLRGWPKNFKEWWK